MTQLSNQIIRRSMQNKLLQRSKSRKLKANPKESVRFPKCKLSLSLSISKNKNELNIKRRKIYLKSEILLLRISLIF